MTTALQPAVGLLAEAVDYTRQALTQVTPDALRNPTPCRAWDLGQLLEHMDDSLDAFTEASAGSVRLLPRRIPGDVLDRLQTKACALLIAWHEYGHESWHEYEVEPSSPDNVAAQATTAGVLVGDRRLAADILVRAGALEIAVHGWDVGQATGHVAPIPQGLAALLLPIAKDLVTPADRPDRFAEPQPQGSGAPEDEILLGYLGRIA